jgi:serine/threonine-protein kinase
MKLTTPPTRHPSTDDLVAFAQGLLGSGPAAVVEVHLSQCNLCAGKIADAPDDDFVGLLKAAGRSVFADELGKSVDCLADTVETKAVSDLDRLPPELREHPRYKFEKLLATGAMGEVYLALDSVLSRPVAVKVLKPEMAGNPARKKRFLQEARIATRLRHPNVVEVLHSAPAGESAYIVMEFVAGETLAEIVGRRGPLAASEACIYVRQAAVGLLCAEQHGVVHRDIKPQNLIFDPQTGLVKILDFGLGRLVDEHRTGSRLTREGDILGTVHYLSPEQAADSRQADIRSDIYSLGCVFFYLLSGFPPFSGRNPLEVLRKHKEEAPPSLRELRPDVPPEVAGLVERMLAKDPAGRPQSPAEVMAALTPDEPAASAEKGALATSCPGVVRPDRLPAGLIPILLSPAVVLPALTLLACLLWLLRR